MPGVEGVFLGTAQNRTISIVKGHKRKLKAPGRADLEIPIVQRFQRNERKDYQWENAKSDERGDLNGQ